MRTYIFTDQERKIIAEYLKTGERSVAFNMILHRIRFHLKSIENDFGLIEHVLKEVEIKG